MQILIFPLPLLSPISPKRKKSPFFPHPKTEKFFLSPHLLPKSSLPMTASTRPSNTERKMRKRGRNPLFSRVGGNTEGGKIPESHWKSKTFFRGREEEKSPEGVIPQGSVWLFFVDFSSVSQQKLNSASRKKMFCMDIVFLNL